jgi:plasmid stabilization system protein ParE
MNSFVLSPEAERDLEAIKAYLLKEAGVRITRQVMRELRAGIRFVAKNPKAGHVREDLTAESVRASAMSERSSDGRFIEDVGTGSGFLQTASPRQHQLPGPDGRSAGEVVRVVPGGSRGFPKTCAFGS